jgi:hypothetical protein
MAHHAMRRTSRRRPCNPATPSTKQPAAISTLEHDFDLNKPKTLKKKIYSAQQENDIRVIPKAGGFRVFFSPTLYELFKEETYNLLDTPICKNSNIKHHIDKGKNVYSSTIKLNMNTGSCSINMYHTKSSLLVNGRQSHMVMQSWFPQISKNIMKKAKELCLLDEHLESKLLQALAQLQANEKAASAEDNVNRDICYACHTYCEEEAAECEVGKHWVHLKCDKLTKKEIRILRKDEDWVAYHCLNCIPNRKSAVVTTIEDTPFQAPALKMGPPEKKSGNKHPTPKTSSRQGAHSGETSKTAREEAKKADKKIPQHDTLKNPSLCSSPLEPEKTEGQADSIKCKNHTNPTGHSIRESRKKGKRNSRSGDLEKTPQTVAAYANIENTTIFVSEEAESKEVISMPDNEGAEKGDTPNELNLWPSPPEITNLIYSDAEELGGQEGSMEYKADKDPEIHSMRKSRKRGKSTQDKDDNAKTPQKESASTNKEGKHRSKRETPATTHIWTQRTPIPSSGTSTSKKKEMCKAKQTQYKKREEVKTNALLCPIGNEETVKKSKRRVSSKTANTRDSHMNTSLNTSLCTQKGTEGNSSRSASGGMTKVAKK